MGSMQMLLMRQMRFILHLAIYALRFQIKLSQNRKNRSALFHLKESITAIVLRGAWKAFRDAKGYG